MLNYIWAGMILLGVIYGVCTGQMSALTGGALDSAGEAVSLCITMAGVMALWMGLMEIAQESGMITKMTKGIRPFLKFMFPRHSHKSDRQCAGAWLGVYPGGTESHGTAGEAGGAEERTAADRAAGNAVCEQAVTARNRRTTGERTAWNECVSCQQ